MSTMPKIWDDSVAKSYLTPEATQKSKEQFLETHIDINKIRADYLAPHQKTDEFVTQEEFRDAILKSNVEDQNRIFILRGETGSGKSQLCQWLEYQIGTSGDGVSENHVALHISRSNTGISDIVNILSKPVGVEYKVSNIEDKDPEEMVDAIIPSLRVKASDFSPEKEQQLKELIQDRQGGTNLRDILIKNIEEYQEAAVSGGEKRKPDLLTEKQYRNLSVAAFGEGKGRDTLFPTLRSQIHGIISNLLDVPDFQQSLEDLSAKYKERGLRPVLICEDVTTFSVLKEQLLDQIFELKTGNYDVVLGWTSGWEKDQLSLALGTTGEISTYMEDRAEGYLSTTDDLGQAYFLDDDVTVALARRYMSVIREKSSPEESLSEDVIEAFDGMYPFNPQFVKQAYNHLIQDGNQRRTPRLLLQRVIRECLGATVPPHKAIEGNPYIENFPTPVDMTYSSEAQQLAKWYGSPTVKGGQLRVRNKVLETFDVEAPKAEADDEWTYFRADVAGLNLDLSLVGGTLRPGEEIKLRATLGPNGEEDVEVSLEDSQLGTTDETGHILVNLPEQSDELVFTASKDGAQASLEVTIDANLMLSVNPKQVNVGERAELTARLDGVPEEGVIISADGKKLGETNHEGKLVFEPSEAGVLRLEGQSGSFEDGVELVVVDPEPEFPVDVDMPQKEVNERLVQFRNWVKSGEEYPSSKILRDGAAGVLNEWYDPTVLGNKNATNDGVYGIYFRKGKQVPVSIVGVDDRQSISFDLEFGEENYTKYDPLFWYGISAEGQFPYEDRYNLNYDTLHEWADKQVTSFRNKMREEIEGCLPGIMTIEEFIVFSQFLILNATTGRDTIDREMVFKKPPKSGEGYVPGALKTNQPDEFAEATDELLQMRSLPYLLAPGFFQLKSNVVDKERLEWAIGRVESNLDHYLVQAMKIKGGSLSTGYEVSTTRSKKGLSLKKFLQRVKTYANELDRVKASKNASYIENDIKRIKEVYDPTDSPDDLESRFSELNQIIAKLEVPKKDEWDKAEKKSQRGSQLDLENFGNKLRHYSDLSGLSGYQLISELHEYRSSREVLAEWEIYESIAEMVQKAEDKDLPEDNGFRERIKNLEEMREYERQRQALESVIGGE